MSEHDRDGMASDEMLVAFLDGQLPPEEQRALADRLENDGVLAQRLAFLGSGRAPFRDAFDALLGEAPTDRMAENFKRAAMRNDNARIFTRRHMIAAAVTAVAVGVAGDRGIDAILGRQSQDDEGWRSVVASYMSLYSTLTLSHLALDPAMLDAQVASVSQVLALSMNRKDITLPDLEFKRVQMLQFKGKPLAQFAYLDSASQPLALCVFASSKGAALPQLEQRHGMNVVFWSTASHSFLVIGHAFPDTLERLAGRLRETLPA